jgi:RNA polymerase sigma-70 factor, ECF subfamily
VDELTSLAMAAGRGDRQALAAFVRRSQADVWRFCASMNGRAAADDLTQDTFVRAIPSLGRFEGRSNARVWLLSIARRTCADAVRSSVRQRRLLERLAGDPETLVPHGYLEIEQMVLGLDPDRRQAFVLTQVLGLSYAEAADACDCPIGTIRSRVARAREDLLVDVTEAESQ